MKQFTEHCVQSRLVAVDVVQGSYQHIKEPNETLIRRVGRLLL
jgi:hypothetical protein